MIIRFLALACAATVAVVLTACSTTFEGSKVDYKSQAKQGPGLEVPPDLSQINRDRGAVVPVGGTASASTTQGANQQGVPASSAAVAVNAMGDVRVQRDGSQRWLVVDRSPEKIWDEVKTFWTDHGFVHLIDQPTLGILETDWAENRAKLPQDWFRKTFGGLVSGLYKTHERDKFRTRMERTANGGTEIYITHRGMAEDFTTSQKDALKWMARPTDSELEIEFLKRLMARLGASQEAAAQALSPAAVAASKPRASVVQEGANVSLIVFDPMEQAWRRVGLSLDRTNFTVEDRDRSKGIYFVRYVQVEPEKNAPGFFARVMGAKPAESLQKYHILVTAEGSQSRVRVANLQGQILNTPDAQSILKVLAADLK